MFFRNDFNFLRVIVFCFPAIFFFLDCTEDQAIESEDIVYEVPHEARWGIYKLHLSTEAVDLIYSSSKKISFLDLNHKGDRFAFSQKLDGQGDSDEEVCILNTDGTLFTRLTENHIFDLYPVWSPDDSKIAFLSFPGETMDIYIMDADGKDRTLLYDSGSHDADIDWQAGVIVFTSESKIWSMDSGGTNPVPITDPPRGGEWGNAVLPFGDYDPRLNPSGTKILFERMEEDTTVHGNYNLFSVNRDGTEETRLTSNGYTQGIVDWSHSGDRLVYMVSAIGSQGVYDLYMMNSDGTENRNITPDYFSAQFLCYTPQFSLDDSAIYFVGEWWE